jgi:hypothetical protein
VKRYDRDGTDWFRIAIRNDLLNAVKTGKAGFENAACATFIGILREFMGTYSI